LLRLFSGKDVRFGEIQNIIGYRFRDPQLLQRALTHRSLVRDHNGVDRHANELLELLGDAVLAMTVVEYLYHRFYDRGEGELSKIKAMLVSGKSLQSVARTLQLGDHILMSENEARNGGRLRDSILEDTCEAVIGALYLDGGWIAANRFIQRHILAQADRLANETEDFNHKSQLLEYAQARGLPAPDYRVRAETGPDHAKEFQVEVFLDGKSLGIGVGRSKKDAQQKAAQMALGQLPGAGT
jgi:ribonuclease-3